MQYKSSFLALCLLITTSNGYAETAPTTESVNALLQVRTSASASTTQVRQPIRENPRPEFINSDNQWQNITTPMPAATATASATLVTPMAIRALRNNGNPANRVDIVMIGDGYTSNEQSIFTSHAQTSINDFFIDPVFAEYQSFFNVWMVDVVSPESGVDNDPLGTFRNTALDMTYNCNGIERLLCVDTTKAIQAANNFAGWDQLLVIANSSKYGGAGYMGANIGTFAGANSASVEVALHEFGHSFAGLADEYDSGGPETYTGGEPGQPNITTLNAGNIITQQQKWWRWMGSEGVDAFEGANYSVRGIFRPTLSSKMRALLRPFDAVNREQIVLSAYKKVNPIDDATPAVEQQAGAVLFVKPVKPATHNLTISWWLNGTKIANASGETLDTSTLSLNAGANTIAVRVVDNTPWVRDENARQQFMTSERIWTVNSTQQSTWKRTVVFIEGVTQSGQDMFIRGGIDHTFARNNLGFNCDIDKFKCAMPIRHLNFSNATTAPWKTNDNFLDWHGAEPGQSTAAQGSPLDWTINSWPSNWGTKRTVAVDGYGETPLNIWGAHYWMLEVEMDCSKTVNGWFELKSYISNGPGWEGNVSQPGAPYSSGNHFAQCGKLSVFKRGQSNPVTITNL